MKQCLVVIGGYNPGHLRAPSSCVFLPQGLEYSFYDLNDCDFQDLEKYDCMIVFTSLESANTIQLNRIMEFSERDNRILLFIHEACIFERNNEAFKHFIGIRFKSHNPYGEFMVQKSSQSPILNGCSDIFCVSDELYFYDKKSFLCDSEIMLKEKQTRNVIMFSKVFSNSHSILYYISIGHDCNTLASKDFKRIVSNILLS